MKPLKIYLADLTHEGSGRLAVDMMPYNIGLIAAYAKKILGDQVRCRLFKYVASLLSALREEPPDILACSNYVWNSHLSHFACETAKQIQPKTLTVFGGTNYPFDAKGQLAFLKMRPAVDHHVFYEGEQAFVHLIQAFREDPDPQRLRERAVDGCQSVSPTTGELVSGRPVPRLRNLEEVPSPYTTGLLDEFFDGKLIPLLETNRGCPFTCNFCNAGDRYFTKVSMFPMEHLEEELTYIARRIGPLGVGTLMLADNNFGMYPRDAEICRILKKLQDEHGWPMRILSTTGKNNKERILSATEILGTSIAINMSVQSMNKTVLTHIKRQNVRLETYREVNEVLLRQGRTQKAEVIVPLPGETYETFLAGLRQLMASRAQLIYSYTLQLLYGTDYKDPDYRRRWGYEGKWRLVPLNFGEYEGRKLFDAEEVAVSSSTLSFEEYLKIRLLALLTEVMYNDYQCLEIVQYLQEQGIAPFDWIQRTLDHLPEAPEAIREVVAHFIRDTREELWDSEEALFAHYRDPENYQKLIRGQAGHNVVFTHKGIMISRHAEAWLSFITEHCLALVLRAQAGRRPAQEIRSEVEALHTFLSAKLRGVLKPEADTRDLFVEMRYDILGWLRQEETPLARNLSGLATHAAKHREAIAAPLRDYRLETPRVYRFYFSPKQLKEREEIQRLYGFDRIGLSRIFARNPSLNTLFRCVESVESAQAGQRLTGQAGLRAAWNN